MENKDTREKVQIVQSIVKNTVNVYILKEFIKYRRCIAINTP